MKSLAVLLPLRPFGRGKTRLAESFDEATRAGIAHGLALRAMAAAAEAFPGADRFLTGERELESFASATGAELLEQPRDVHGLAPAVDAALSALDARGYARAVVMMGDLPDVVAEDLRELDQLEPDVAFAENASGHGTNAMMLRLPAAFQTAFGDPFSAELHSTRAHAAGCRIVRVRLASLARDVDLPSDLHVGEVEALVHAARTRPRL